MPKIVTYYKIKKVISSCSNVEQLKIAKRMFDNAVRNKELTATQITALTKQAVDLLYAHSNYPLTREMRKHG